MGKDHLFLVDLAKVELNEHLFAEGHKNQASWIHALPLGTYSHPVYGEMNFDQSAISRYAESVKVKVRGIDPSINYQHQGDGEAAGWVKNAEAREDGLWLFVEWTTDAARKIKDKAYRYFSAEFLEEWTNNLGKKFENVIFGGALTNRPFMKNLLPVNLSEGTIENALAFAEIITVAKVEHEKETQPKEQDMDRKKLAELLGLPGDSNEETIVAKLAELKGTPPAAPPAPVRPSVPVVDLSAELKKLSEENPMVAKLIETVDAQNKALSDYNNALKLADVERRLSEFDHSKIVLTPNAKDLLHDLAMDIEPPHAEKLWKLMEMMRNASGVMVELGERAGTSVRYGRSKDQKSLFMDEANRIAQEKKISLSEAMDQVARANPAMYQGYRSETYAFKE